ncbi:hypothetical protein [Variovorax rhizosphaerae]|uniref:Uncharacterized protein n=1 Tax=Variovorax rhizosphaerae TaxID=1836200 RepID=A0ABU8WQY6_9BURK
MTAKQLDAKAIVALRVHHDMHEQFTSESRENCLCSHVAASMTFARNGNFNAGLEIRY